MSWASKRQFTYGTIVIAVIIFAISIPAYLYLNKPPTCIDNKQNGDEKGVDCGGSCDTLCVSQISDPIIQWSKVFKVSDGVYDAVAYVENPNVNAGVKKVIYKFKLYDKNNVLVAERVGKTFIGQNEQFAIFESNIRTGKRIPKNAFLEFKQGIDWTRLKISKADIPNIFARNKNISGLETKPRLNALLVNDDPFKVLNIEVVAILYDINGNSIAVSSTVVDSMAKNSTKNVTFTWTKPFSTLPVKIEIIPRTNLFKIE